MIHIDNGPVKHKQDAQTPKEPERQALIASVMPGSGGLILKLKLLHVLVMHCGIATEAEAYALVNRAIVNGKSVIRLGTKDVIDTLLHECQCCNHASDHDFRFTSEPA